jgi:hypothetical protein
LLAVLASVAALAVPRPFAPDAPEAAPIDDPKVGGDGMELVEQFWGRYYDVTVKDNLVYFIVGQRFYVFSIANPANPVLLGKSDLMPNPSIRMDVDGNYAYLADPGVAPNTTSPGAGLHVLDVSNPAIPTEIAFFDSPKYAYLDVDVFSGYAYVGDAIGYLSIFDVSNPAAPYRVKSLYAAADDILQVQVVQHPVNGKVYAYGISSGNEFFVMDVSNPLQPSLAGSLALPVWSLSDFAVQGARALVADDDLGNLHLIDLANPAQPVLVASTSFPPDQKSISSFDWYGDSVLAYQWGLQKGLLIMDASGTGLPVEVGFYPTQSGGVVGGEVNGLQLALMSSGNGLDVVNITDPALPAPLGSYVDEGSLGSLQMVGDLLYFTGGQGLRIYRRVGAGLLEYVGGLDQPGSLRLVQDGKAYLGNRYYDLSVGDEIKQLIVVDVSNPSQPQALDSLDLDSYPIDVFVYGSKAYLASRQQMQIVDVSNPAALALTGVFTDTLLNPPDFFSVAVAPNPDNPAQLLAYLADYRNGVAVLDVTQPLSITRKLTYKPWEVEDALKLDFIDLPGASGEYLAVASGDDGYLSLLDITHPFSPTILASHYLGCDPNNLLTMPGQVYVACDLEGGQLYRASPTELETSGYYRYPYAVWDVAVSGDFLYMAAGSEGLFEVWRAPASWSSIPITGGLLTSEYYSLTLEFPADTFTETTYVYLRPRFYGNMPVTFKTIGAEYYYELTMSSNLGTKQPLKPYQVEWQYDPADFPGTGESMLGLYYWDGVRWVREPSSAVDTAANLVSATPQHASLWALLAERQGVQEIFLPLVNR